jgi:hypothetical protein
MILTSCKSPSVEMTDEYIEVTKPGQRFGIVELVDVEMDSTFGYPIRAKELRAVTLVDRTTHKQISKGANEKVYFNKKNDRYCWQIANDIFLANYEYSDTIHLKPKTWYSVIIENTTYDKYFYWNGGKSNYLIKSKPRPGAF